MGKLLPFFEHDDFNQWIKTHQPESIEIGGALSIENGLIEIPDVLAKISLLKQKYRSSNHIDLQTAKATKIGITGLILFNEFEGPKIVKELKVP